MPDNPHSRLPVCPVVLLTLTVPWICTRIFQYYLVIFWLCKYHISTSISPIVMINKTSFKYLIQNMLNILMKKKKKENYYVIYIKYRKFWYRSSATADTFLKQWRNCIFYFLNILWTYFSKYYDRHFAISAKLFAVFLAAQAYWKYMPVVKLLQNVTLLLAMFLISWSVLSKTNGNLATFYYFGCCSSS